MSAMQYGWVLDRLIIQVVISDPELGPVCILKADISNSFYRTRLQLTDTHKLVFVPPSDVSGEELVEITLTLPMVWKNFPPIFCTATPCATTKSTAKKNHHEEVVVIPDLGPLQPALKGLSHDLYPKRSNVNPTAYMNIFFDDFFGLSQGPTQKWYYIRCTLFHAMDKVF